MTTLEDRVVPVVTTTSVFAIDDTVAASAGVPTTFAVLANDGNPIGPGPVVIGHTDVSPPGPSLAQNPDGTFTFSSNTSGTFSFNYTVSGGEAKVTGSGNFGYGVSISGDTAVIAAPGEYGSAGEAYVFVRNGTAWVQQAILTDGAGPAGSGADSFGASVAVDGNTIVVGKAVQNSETGAAFVFVRNGSNWSEQAVLTANDGTTGDAFGRDLAVSGDTAVVTAPEKAAYVFVRTGTSWTQQAELISSDHSAGDGYAGSVALDADTVVVGAANQGGQGAAYVFGRNGIIWNQQVELVASDAQSGDLFGESVAVSGGTALIGSAAHNSGGGAYAFVRVNNVWTQQAELHLAYGTANTVALNNNTAVIGIPGGNSEAGIAYVFVRNGDSWSQQQQIIASDGAPNSHFGSSVSISNGMAVFGSTFGESYFRNVTTATASVNVVVGATTVVIATTPGTLAYTQGQAAIAVDPGVTVTAQGATLASASVQITGQYSSGQDVLGFTHQNGITGNFDPATGTLTLAGTASVADYQTALRSVTFFTNSAASLSRTVTFTASDGTTTSLSANRAINIATAVVIATSSGALAYAESQPAIAVDSSLTVTAQSATLASATVQIASNYTAGKDVLSYTTNIGIVGSFDSATGTLNLSGVATVADYQAALRSVTFYTNADTLASRIVTIAASDGTNTSPSASRTIAVSISPVIVTNIASMEYVENQSPQPVDPSLSVISASSSTLIGATVQIIGNYVPGSDALLFNDQNGITSLFDSATGILTLSGVASVADYQAALSDVSFFTSNITPDPTSRIVSFIVDDGTLSSSQAFRNVSVMPLAPAVGASGSLLFYTIGQGATAVDTGLSVAAGGVGTISGATVQITQNYAASQDLLGFTNQTGINGSFDSQAGTLTLTGTASAAAYQSALRTVTLFSTGPSTATRTVSFIVTDGNLGSLPANELIGFQLPTPPVIVTTGTSLPYQENDPAEAIDANLTVSGGFATGATVRIAGNYIAGHDVLGFTDRSSIDGIKVYFSAATGTLTLTGNATVANYQTALRSVTFFTDVATPTSRTITFLLSNGVLSSAPANRSIAIADAPLPNGSEFEISSVPTNALMAAGNRAVAMDGQGDFVAVWQMLTDGSGYGIYAQRYSAAGVAEGSQFLVNTYTTNDQMYPSVAMNAAGNFVIAWQSFGQDGSDTGIFAQRFDVNGVKQGGEIAVNSFTPNSQGYPMVAMDAAGNFVITWMSQGQTTDPFGFGLFAQAFNAAGVKRGGEFRVNKFPANQAPVESIAMDPAGDFVIAWMSYGEDGSNWGILAKRYNAAAQPQGDEFRVNTFTLGDQTRASVTMDATGNFVIAWTSANQDGSGDGIFAQRFNAAGVRQGGEFQVNTFTTDHQEFPSVALDAAGDTLIVWQSSPEDGSGYGIYGQRYDPSGAPQGNEFRINTTTLGHQQRPSVAMDPAGDSVVTWFGGGRYLYEMFGQQYNASPTVPVEPSLNVDGSRNVSALTDGILSLRYMFGFSGSTLTAGALNPDATRTNPASIKSALDGARSTLLDPDGNGKVDPLTDGILILRYLFGFTGTSLTTGALGQGATRTTPEAIEAYLNSYNPGLGHLSADTVGAGAQPSDLLTPSALQQTTTTAVARWEAAGITPAQAAALVGVQFQIADFAGTRLAGNAGKVVLIDLDAAGFGWYVDPTPQVDSEFGKTVGPTELQAGTGSPASGRIDLLTVVMHELGLVMGLQDLDPSVAPHSLMTDVLSAGVRRLPSSTW